MCLNSICNVIRIRFPLLEHSFITAIYLSSDLADEIKRLGIDKLNAEPTGSDEKITLNLRRQVHENPTPPPPPPNHNRSSAQRVIIYH